MHSIISLRRGKPARRLSMLGAAVLTCFAGASGPDNQYGYKTPVVRIFSGEEFQGTGTVIDHHMTMKNGRMVGTFCILTADHVIATGVDGAPLANLKAAFGKYKDVDLGFTPSGGAKIDADVIARKGIDAAHPNERVDMALLRVEYGDYNQAYDSFVMPLSPMDIGIGEDFSSAGYGNIANRFIENVQRNGGILQPDGMWWNGYKGTNTFEEQRFWYNSVNDVFMKQNWDDLPPDEEYAPSYDPYGPVDDPRGYVYETMVFDNTVPTATSATVGEGTGFNGDSGAPYMRWFNGQSAVVGIHTYGSYLVGTRTKLWGFRGGGVKLNNQYRGWITQNCLTPVPEPASFAALAFALVPMLRRRRR